MKIRCSALIVAASLVFGSGVVFADAGHSHAPDSHAGSKVDSSHEKSADEIFTALDGVVGQITAAVNSKELSKLHDLTEEVSHLASHIAEKTPAEKQARVSGSAKNISNLANAMHSASDKGDQAGVEANLKKLQSMMTILRGQLK